MEILLVFNLVLIFLTAGIFAYVSLRRLVHIEMNLARILQTLEKVEAINGKMVPPGGKVVAQKQFTILPNQKVSRIDIDLPGDQ